jgi:predicted GIY-YIG superfamily endonuclease
MWMSVHYDERTVRHLVHGRNQRLGHARLAAPQRRGIAVLQRYGLTRLVYAEEHDRIDEAIAREKAIKAWKRCWKTELIEKTNPAWDDLFERLNW